MSEKNREVKNTRGEKMKKIENLFDLDCYIAHGSAEEVDIHSKAMEDLEAMSSLLKKSTLRRIKTRFQNLSVKELKSLVNHLQKELSTKQINWFCSTFNQVIKIDIYFHRIQNSLLLLSSTLKELNLSIEWKIDYRFLSKIFHFLRYFFRLNTLSLTLQDPSKAKAIYFLSTISSDNSSFPDHLKKVEIKENKTNKNYPSQILRKRELKELLIPLIRSRKVNYTLIKQVFHHSGFKNTIYSKNIFTRIYHNSLRTTRAEEVVDISLEREIYGTSYIQYLKVIKPKLSKLMEDKKQREREERLNERKRRNGNRMAHRNAMAGLMKLCGDCGIKNCEYCWEFHKDDY